MEPRYDVTVIGGGVAGLSGAVTLGRARRKVLLVDDRQPRNGAAGQVHGFLSRDGVDPWRLLEEGRFEAARFGVSIVDASVELVRRNGDHFVVLTDTSTEFVSRRLLIATGVIDELPAVTGLSERWGRDVIHCPYCHGWEIRDQPVAVLGTGLLAAQHALLFRQWSPQVTLLTHTAPKPTDADLVQLVARGVNLIGGIVAAVEVSADCLRGVRMLSGGFVPCEALVVLPRVRVRAEFVRALDLQPQDRPYGTGQYVPTDEAGRTVEEGVWAAGDITGVHGGVVGSAADGVAAAMSINGDLIAEDTRHALLHL